MAPKLLEICPILTSNIFIPFFPDQGTMPHLQTILVTGGAGYIGSHCVVDLLQNGHDVIAIDNFANAVEDEHGSAALQRVEQITGKSVRFYKADLLDKGQINDIFDKVSLHIYERKHHYQTNLIPET